KTRVRSRAAGRHSDTVRSARARPRATRARRLVPRRASANFSRAATRSARHCSASDSRKSAAGTACSLPHLRYAVRVEEPFETHRRLLHGIAYRMLGSVADTEDVLQEARIRWLAAPHAEIATPRSYLVTI